MLLISLLALCGRLSFLMLSACVSLTVTLAGDFTKQSSEITAKPS
jgi:hypothetical protein